MKFSSTAKNQILVTRHIDLAKNYSQSTKGRLFDCLLSYLCILLIFDFKYMLQEGKLIKIINKYREFTLLFLTSAFFIRFYDGFRCCFYDGIMCRKFLFYLWSFLHSEWGLGAEKIRTFGVIGEWICWRLNFCV